jgi:hypothetical protein
VLEEILRKIVLCKKGDKITGLDSRHLRAQGIPSIVPYQEREILRPVLRIHISPNAEPVPDLDPGFYHNADPDHRFRIPDSWS